MTDTLPVAAEPSRPMALSRPKSDILQFGTIAEVMRFAEMIQHAEGAIPRHMLKNPGKIVATVMAGHELGIGPMASLRAFHVVEGKPTADYSFWIARLKASGYRIRWIEKGQERVTLQLVAPDGTESAPETWDKARAITAGLWGKGTWKLYPQTMLAARAVTSCGRAFAAEVMFGCYETDEAEEIMKDAQARVSEAAAAPPNGTPVERVIAAVGQQVDQESAEREQRAKECVDMLRALGMDRPGLFALLKELGIQHTDKTRVAELSREDLEKLAERLDREAANRADGGPKDGPTREKPKAEPEPDREPGQDA